jgi:hypothetical protein
MSATMSTRIADDGPVTARAPIWTCCTCARPCQSPNIDSLRDSNHRTGLANSCAAFATARYSG